MRTHYLSPLPIATQQDFGAPEPAGACEAMQLFVGSDITCLYIIGTNESYMGALELPIELHYVAQDKSFVIIRRAYRYAACEESHCFIYSLPALIPLSAIPSEYKDLVDQPSTVLDFEVHIPLPDGTKENLGLASLCIATNQTSTKTLEGWLTFFDFLLYNNKIIDFDNQLIVRFKSLNELLEKFCEDDKKAPRSIILKIAEKASDVLPVLSHKLRKNLLNTRTLLPVERINALDGKCLEYLLKIEGQTIREKAQKNKLKLMGLTKVESFNLLENRVLKDFLFRCNQKASSYLQDFEEYLKENKGANDHDVQKIRIFKSRCNDLSKNSDIANVPRQLSLPKPNFVLLKDPYYKKIWELYLDLIHEKNEIDQTVDCQQNLFHDICDLLINTALCHLCELPNETKQHNYLIRTITKSYVKLNGNIMAGHRIQMGCNAGPFLVYRSPYSNCVIEVISNGSENIAIPQQILGKLSQQNLLATAPSYLLFSKTISGSQNDTSTVPPQQTGGQHSDLESQADPASSDGQRLIVPLYTIHANACTEDNILSIKQRLSQMSEQLRPFAKQVHPCFILSTSLEIEDLQHLCQQEAYSIVLVHQHPRNWLASRDTFQHLLSALIEQFLANDPKHSLGD